MPSTNPQLPTASSIMDFKPLYGRLTGVGVLNVLLMGEVNAGKSEFVSTVDTAVHPEETDHLRNTAPSSCTPETPSSVPFTSEFESYRLTSRLRMYDTWGYNQDNYKKAEFMAKCKGLAPDGWKRLRAEGDDSSEDLSPPQFLHLSRMHCVIFFIASENYTEDKSYERVHEFIKSTRNLPFPPGIIVVLSKVDKIDENVREDPASVWTSPTIREARMHVSTKTGVNPNYVLPHMSYYMESQRNDHIDGQTLLVAQRALQAAEEGLRRQFAKLNDDIAHLPADRLWEVDLQDINMEPSSAVPSPSKSRSKHHGGPPKYEDY